MSRCDRRECVISDFTVELSINAGDVTFQIVDPCNTLTSQRLIKSVILDAANQFFHTEEVTPKDANVSCECECGPEGFDFYFGEKKAVLKNTGLVTLEETEYKVTIGG